MASPQQRLQTLSEQYQALEQGNPPFSYLLSSQVLMQVPELQTNIQSRQKLESQQQENRGVQKVPRKLTYWSAQELSKRLGVLELKRWCQDLQVGGTGTFEAG